MKHIKLHSGIHSVEQTHAAARCLCRGAGLHVAAMLLSYSSNQRVPSCVTVDTGAAVLWYVQMAASRVGLYVERRSLYISLLWFGFNGPADTVWHFVSVQRLRRGCCVYFMFLLVGLKKCLLGVVVVDLFLIVLDVPASLTLQPLKIRVVISSKNRRSEI